MPNTNLAPLANALPDDKYWAAKQVMTFTDDDIRALVQAGQYSDPRAAEWLSECLIRRRDKIGRAFFSDVLPLEEFKIEDGRLKFKHLGAHYGFTPEPSYTVQWTTFNNLTGERAPLTGANELRVPQQATDAETGTYFAVRLSGDEYGKNVDVFFRKEASSLKIVGVERNWPGKRIVKGSERGRKVRSSYPDLEGRRKTLFDDFTKQYNEKTSFALTPEQYFASLSVSQRTTFDAVTHALMKTNLSDESGAPLGIALDLVAGIDRISGQQYGRQGDEQFRIYVTDAGGCPGDDGEVPTILPQPRKHCVSRSVFRSIFARPARCQLFRSRCRKTVPKRTSTWTTVPAKCPKQCGTVI